MRSTDAMAAPDAATVDVEPALAALRAQVLDAARDGRALRIAGAGSHGFLAASCDGDVLDATSYRGIVSYEPTELVITARCGTPLAEIEAELHARGQCLPFEPPRFGGAGAGGAGGTGGTGGAAGTIGGAIATGLSGPRRPWAGSAGDHVLGTVLLDAHGRVLRFGGQVMKNVAGYDVSRLLCGSQGVLGLIAEVSLKVLPVPLHETTLVFEHAQQQSIDALNRWGGQPLPVSASWWHGGRTMVRLSGARAAIDAAVARMGGQRVEAAGDLWTPIRDQRAEPFRDTCRVCWRLSLPPTAPALDLPGDTALEWGGALRWWWPPQDEAGAGAGGPGADGAGLVDAAQADALRRRVEALGGTAWLWRGRAPAGVPVEHPLSRPALALHRRIRAAFDPQRRFNRGRLFQES